jgi:predicted RNA-binding protein
MGSNSRKNRRERQKAACPVVEMIAEHTAGDAVDQIAEEVTQSNAKQVTKKTVERVSQQAAEDVVEPAVAQKKKKQQLSSTMASAKAVAKLATGKSIQ